MSTEPLALTTLTPPLLRQIATSLQPNERCAVAGCCKLLSEVVAHPAAWPPRLKLTLAGAQLRDMPIAAIFPRLRPTELTLAVRNLDRTWTIPLEWLKGMHSLRALHLLDALMAGKGQLAHLAGLSSLTELGYVLDDGECKTVATLGLPLLTRLQVTTADASGVAALVAARTPLQHLSVSAADMGLREQPALFDALRRLPLRHLTLSHRWPFTERNRGLRFLRECRSLERLSEVEVKSAQAAADLVAAARDNRRLQLNLFVPLLSSECVETILAPLCAGLCVAELQLHHARDEFGVSHALGSLSCLSALTALRSLDLHTAMDCDWDSTLQHVPPQSLRVLRLGDERVTAQELTLLAARFTALMSLELDAFTGLNVIVAALKPLLAMPALQSLLVPDEASSLTSDPRVTAGHPSWATLPD